MASNPVDVLLVRVEADLRDLRNGLKQLDDRIDKSQRKAERGFGKIGTAVKSVLGAAVVFQTARAGLALVNFTSHVEEMQAKSSVVFGRFAGDVRSQLQAFGDEVGRSAFQLEEMAASVQDTFVPMGFARGEAAQLSVQLAKLATDVASFNNASDTETMAAFQSALVGNHETVRRFGIVITEAELNAELFRMGLGKTSQQATAAEKVQARLNLILAGTTDAQGDAARTSESFANQSKALSAALENLAVEVVNPLLDDLAGLVANLTAATNSAREFAKAIGLAELSVAEQQTKSLASATDELAEAQKELAHLRALKQFNEEASAGEKLLAGVAGRLTEIEGKEFSPFELALSPKQVDKQIAELEQKVIQSRNRINATFASINVVPDAPPVEDDKGPEENAKANQEVEKSIKKLTLANRLLSAELSGKSELERELLEIETTMEGANAKRLGALAEQITKNHDLKKSLELVQAQRKIDIEAIDEANEKQQQFTDRVQDEVDALTLLQMQMNGASEAEIRARDIRQQNKDLTEAQLEVLIDLAQAQADATTAIDSRIDREQVLNDAMAEGISFVESQKSELEKLNETLVSLNLAFANGKISQSEFAEALESIKLKIAELDPMTKQLISGFEQAGNAVADSLAKGFVEGELSMKSFQNIAKRFVSDLIAEFIRVYVIRRIMSSIVSGFTGGGGDLTATEGSFAGGGAVQARTPIMVGERGPEIFVPHSAGNVLNKMNAGNALGGGQPVIVNQSINVETGVSQTVRAEMMSMMPVFKQEAVNAVVESRRRGGVVATTFGG